VDNFYKLADNLNIMPLMAAIVRQPELWNQNKFRTTFQNTPHADVSDIWIRFSEIKENLEDILVKSGLILKKT